MKKSVFTSSLALVLALAASQASQIDGAFSQSSRFQARSLLSSVELGNGAQLTVNVDSPSNGATVAVGDTCTATTTFNGSASVGKGIPNVTYIFVIDESGSTVQIIDEIKAFFNALTDVVFGEGSALNAGVVLFESNTSRSPTLTDNIATIKAKINEAASSGGTNCVAGLDEARALAETSTAATTIVLFAGDGACNQGGSPGPAATQLAALTNTNVIIETIAIEIGCAGDLGTIPRNGGDCNAVTNVNDFEIATVIGTTLKDVDYKINAAPFTSLLTSPTGNQPGPAIKAFSQVIPISLGPNDLCVQATGSDEVSNLDKSVSECILITGVDASVPTITCPANVVANTDAGICTSSVVVSPATAADNCDEDLTPLASTTGPFPLGNSIVTFTVSDDSGNSASCEMSVDVFDDEEPVLTCPADLTVETDPGICTATIEIPIASVTDNCDQSLTPSSTAVNPFSLGSNTVEYTVADAAGNADACDFTVLVVDMEAPTATCTPANNPSGNVPKANNQDGFFQLGGSDNCSVASYHVVDSVSGFVFGPFPSGTVFKYVEAPGGKPSQKLGSGEVDYFLKGKGDAYVLVTDGSGNTATASCLVPPAPSRLLRGN